MPNEPTLHSLHILMTNVEGEIKSLNRHVVDHFEKDEELHKDQEARMRKIERRQWWMTGALGIAVTTIGAKVSGFFNSF